MTVILGTYWCIMTDELLNILQSKIELTFHTEQGELKKSNRKKVPKSSQYEIILYDTLLDFIGEDVSDIVLNYITTDHITYNDRSKESLACNEIIEALCIFANIDKIGSLVKVDNYLKYTDIIQRCLTYILNEWVGKYDNNTTIRKENNCIPIDQANIDAAVSKILSILYVVNKNKPIQYGEYDGLSRKLLLTGSTFEEVIHYIGSSLIISYKYSDVPKVHEMQKKTILQLAFLYNLYVRNAHNIAEQEQKDIGWYNRAWYPHFAYFDLNDNANPQMLVYPWVTVADHDDRRLKVLDEMSATERVVFLIHLYSITILGSQPNSFSYYNVYDSRYAMSIVYFPMWYSIDPLFYERFSVLVVPTDIKDDDFRFTVDCVPVEKWIKWITKHLTSCFKICNIRKYKKEMDCYGGCDNGICQSVFRDYIDDAYDPETFKFDDKIHKLISGKTFVDMVNEYPSCNSAHSKSIKKRSVKYLKTYIMKISIGVGNLFQLSKENIDYLINKISDKWELPRYILRAIRQFDFFDERLRSVKCTHGLPYAVDENVID
jgi:hypothetical protein